MKAKRSALRAMRAKTCDVTLIGTGEGQSITFPASYDSEIPPALYVSLMEMTRVGEDFQKASAQMGDFKGLSDDEAMSRMKLARETLGDIRGRLEELATLLAKVFISQEFYDDDDNPIAPNYEYFSTCTLEDQLAYANALTTEKQRPTMPSGTTQPDASLAEGQKDTPPLSIVASEQQNGQTSPSSDSTTQIQ